MTTYRYLAHILRPTILVIMKTYRQYDVSDFCFNEHLRHASFIMSLGIAHDMKISNVEQVSRLFRVSSPGL